LNKRETALAKREIARSTEVLLPQFEEADSVVRKKGKANAPIPVHTPDGKNVVSWFVGITVGDRIASFLQFNGAGKLIRYSSFQRESKSVEECPKADTWLKSSHVKNRGKSIVGKDALVKKPYLSYHQNITRLAWIVRVIEKDGIERLVYVVGDSVFEEH
jgi:hypothetical protein